MTTSPQPSLLEISRKILSSPREGFELAISDDWHGSALVIGSLSSFLSLVLQYFHPEAFSNSEPDYSSVLFAFCTPLLLYVWAWLVGIIGRLCGGVRNDRAVRIATGFAALPFVIGLIIALPFSFVDGAMGGIFTAMLILGCWSTWITVIGTAVAMKLSFLRATLITFILTFVVTVFFMAYVIFYVLTSIDWSEHGDKKRDPSREVSGPQHAV